MDPNKLTPIQKLEYRFFFDATKRLDHDLRNDLWIKGTIPRDWLTLIASPQCREKTRVTLRLDADLVKFFRRHWGRGYQAELNTALRAFVSFHMSRVASGDTGFLTHLAAIAKEETPRTGQAEELLKGKLLTGFFGAFPEE